MHMTKVYSRRLLACTIASSLTLATPLAAMAPDKVAVPFPPATDAVVIGKKPQTVKLQTVTVSAEKRTTNLQKTASAITAVSADTLNNDNITDVTGLNGHVPGLVVAKSAGGERIMAIRGVGSETPENTQTQPGVAYHIDGVYVVNSIATNAAFIDVDHVEVLRGPQGTLFGESSTGGTINVITKQPKLGRWSGDASLGLGSHASVKTSADLNLPLGKKWALRASVQKNKHRGYAKQTVSGRRQDGEDELGSKVALLWQPLENVTDTLTAINYWGSTSPQAQKNILDPDHDARRLTQDYPGFTHIRSELYYNTLQWDLPFATFKSITSFQKLHANLSWDDDGLDYASFKGYDVVGTWSSDVTSFSQELDLASKSAGPVDWVAGALLLRSTNKQYTVEFNGTDANPDLSIPPTSGPSPYNLSYEYLGAVSRKSLAPFAQATWHVTDRLRLTAGARFNHDRFDGHGSTYYAPQAKLTKVTGNQKTGKLELDYDLAPASMVYASVTRGYKPGGLNGGSVSAMEVPASFAAETINAFEIGSKNRFLDNTLQANFAAFQYNYKNMQYLEEDPIPYSYGIGNIPRTRIRGLESELTYLATPALRFDAQLTYLNGSFRGHYNALDATTAANVRDAYAAMGYSAYSPQTISAVAAAGEDVSGRTPAKLPKWTGNISGSYTLPLGDGSQSMTSRLEYIYRGDFQYGVFNDGPMSMVPSYGLWNLSLQYLPADIHWTYTLSVTNLANKNAVNSRFTDPYGSGQTYNTYVPPRVFMLTAAYSF